MTRSMLNNLAGLLLLAASVSHAASPGTAFTYQGQLTDNGSPANGAYDFRLILYNAGAGGSQVGPILTNSAANVASGLFTASLDFGTVFDGNGYWLEISVRTNGGGAFVPLNPRQPLAPTPYAQYAPSAGAAATAASATTATSVGAGAVTSAGLVDGAVTSAKIADGTIAPGDLNLPAFGGTFWTLQGNAGTSPGVNFIGTTDNLPLDLRVNNERGFRLMPTRSNDTVNVLGGSPLNYVDPNLISGTIAGGGTPSFGGAPRTNSVGSDFATIGGGAGNRIGTNSNSGIISGGFGHTIRDNSFDGTIGGGSFHTIGTNAGYSTVGGGTGNVISDSPGTGGSATIGGGFHNTNAGWAATIAGGWQNFVGGTSDFVGGGTGNAVNANYSVIGGGTGNWIQDNAGAATIGGGIQNVIQTNAQYATIGGGIQNTNGSTFATIGGGGYNQIGTNSLSVVIAGGYGHVVADNSFDAAIGGGSFHSVGTNSYYVTISGGRANQVADNASSTTIGGGFVNDIQSGASYSTIGGGRNNTIQTNAFNSIIGGGSNNSIQSNANNSTVSGGSGNAILGGAVDSTIGGGVGNMVQTNAVYSTIAGGLQNTIQTNASASTIAGGNNNLIESGFTSATISGGFQNDVRGTLSTIGGGFSNATQSAYATVPGGYANVAGGGYSFAAGRRAKANHAGAFVWADSIDADFPSTTLNQFNVRANGGVRFETGGAGLTVDGQPVLSGAVGSSMIQDGTIVNADISATAAIAASKIADGSGSGLNADLLDGLDSAAFWKLGGNAGTTPGVNFLGTTDNQPLQFRVNGQRGVLLMPDPRGGAYNAPSLAGGSANNSISPSVGGAAIVGGGYPGNANSIASGANESFIGAGTANAVNANASDSFIGAGGNNTINAGALNSFIGGGTFNSAGSPSSTITGGDNNVIQTNALESVIAGGGNNLIQTNAIQAVIGGGANNVIQTNAYDAIIGGGNGNTIQTNAYDSTISGGYNNTNAGPLAVVPGGDQNVAGRSSFAAGHRAKATHRGSFVWADDTDVDFNSTTNKQFAVRANNGVMISATNTALEIRGGGAIRVAGAGVGGATPVFIHQATAGNITGDFTTIDHPLCNGDANAILIVTQNWNPGGVGGTYNNHSIGVYYTGGHWTVFNEDGTAMTANAAFNVLIVKP